MGLVCTRKSVEKGCRWQWLSVWWTLALLAAGFSQSQCVAQPVLSLQLLESNANYVQVTLSNCSDTNFSYATQFSTDLVSWYYYETNRAAATNITNYVPKYSQTEFFRVAMVPPLVPYFPLAIATINNFGYGGNGVIVDSFDSTDPTYSTNGQYISTKRMAGGNVLATTGITNQTGLGINIYGHVYTGPGTTAADLQIGAEGAVGDIAWNSSETGIEPGYWTGNYSATFPDVPAPQWVGGLLPSPRTNGPFKGDVFVLGGFSYMATNSIAPSSPIVVVAGIPGLPVQLWVQGSFTLPQIIITNGGSLVLYVGTANSAGNDVLTLPGNTSLNSPGYATNLVIYGLPSLKTITSSGNAAFTTAIYAPEANFANSSAVGTQDWSGSLVANSVTIRGHWNFHFDESLILNGPTH